MDKRVLEEYIDACEVIKDTEEEIRKLESKKRITANETVSGSNPEFPYNPQHFKGNNILLFRRCETSDKERSSETEERESGRTETAGGSVDDIHSLPHAAHHQV